MDIVRLVLLVLSILRALKSAKTREEFSASSAVQQIGGGGQLIEWLWENREEILAFILKLIDMFDGSNSGEVGPAVKALKD